MEAISLKLEGSLLNEIDKNLKKNRYSTRTEFIRDAIRGKLVDLEKEESLRKLRKYFGASKRKTTDEEFRKIRDKVGEQYFKELEAKFK